LERLNWSVLALAQSADIQKRLFPDFVLVADELALSWEDALQELNSGGANINFYQKEKIEALDKLICAISGPNNLKFWIDDALSEFSEWDEIRSAAAEVARSFGWPVLPPPPSQAIYIGTSGSD
jgi:hypothetical protein